MQSMWRKNFKVILLNLNPPKDEVVEAFKNCQISRSLHLYEPDGPTQRLAGLETLQTSLRPPRVWVRTPKPGQQDPVTTSHFRPRNTPSWHILYVPSLEHSPATIGINLRSSSILQNSTNAPLRTIKPVTSSLALDRSLHPIRLSADIMVGKTSVRH